MSHTVWIIDDDNSIRWVLEKALARADILCESYASADLMLQRLEYDQPAVVVSDIRMPGTDGMALLSKLQPQQQFWHDTISGTRVIDNRS